MRKIRQIRLLKEITLDDIFLQTGINQGRLSRIERGILQPTEIEKEKIAKTLNLPISEVFSD